MNAKLPNELIHVILKLKYFNFRKEWLEQNLEFPKLDYIHPDYSSFMTHQVKLLILLGV
jgi:hypothetical protein